MKKKLIVLILVVQIVFFGLFVTSCTKSETVVSYDGIYVDKFSDEAINQLKFVKNAYYVSKIVPEEIKTDKIVIPSTWKDGNKIVSIGPNVLGNNNKITDIVIQEGIMQIMDEAFYECSGLTSITIPDSVTEIGEYAFWGCSGLTSITIPNSVTVIGEGAFWGCNGLTSITIPDSVMGIGTGAFNGCSGLTSITIPDSVTEIGANAFEGCSGLTSITIPDSVTKIEAYAFGSCSGLIEMNYTGTMSQWHNVNKEHPFLHYCPLSVIHCTDGDITGSYNISW